MIRNYPAIARTAALNARIEDDRVARQEATNRRRLRELATLVFAEAYAGFHGFACRDGGVLDVRRDATSPSVTIENKVPATGGSRGDVWIAVSVARDGAWSLRVSCSWNPHVPRVFDGMPAVPDVLMHVAEVVGARWLDPDAIHTDRFAIPDPFTAHELMLLRDLLGREDARIVAKEDAGEVVHPVDRVLQGLRVRFGHYAESHPYHG